MSAREVVAFRGEFRRAAETYSDPGVVLDEISSFRARQDPVVLRVESRGLRAAARARIDGDWLCEPGEAPRLIPAPDWGRDHRTEAWADKRRWVEAWEWCAAPDQMVHAAVDVGCDRRLVVAALCACVREVGAREFPGSGPFEASLRCMERWSLGAEEWSCAGPAISRLYAMAPARARAAALAVVRTNDAAIERAEQARWAAAEAVESLAFGEEVASPEPPGPRGPPPWPAARAAAMTRMAHVVRKHLTTLVVLRAAALPGDPTTGRAAGRTR
jgi:hypothetical protein